MDSNAKNYVIVALATALIVLGLVFVRDALTGSDVPSPSGAAVGGDVELSDEGNYAKGDDDAPVVIYEFSDYQCPFCGRFYTDTLPLIEENYIKTGKVRLIFKDFPLDSIHPEATPAAIAARCAGDQGKFWEMHDKLFENQRTLGNSNYKQWAEEIGLDTAKFGDCIDTRKYLSAVRKDLVEGQQNGIQGTPGFFVNGRLISGAQPFSVFQTAIDAELS